MAFDANIVKKQVIALLGLATRNTSGVPTYDTSLGDNTYADDEIDRGIQDACNEIMRAICETDGHHDRPLFSTSTTVTHGAVLPLHIGSPGVPRITPFSGATFTIVGKRRSVEEINNYRANPGNLYSSTAHDASYNGRQSKLAGFYAIDKATNVIYFTGFSAVADLVKFVEANFTLLPDTYYSTATALAIKHLKKDGDASDVFDHYARIGDEGLAMIHNKMADQPSLKKTVGARDTGNK